MSKNWIRILENFQRIVIKINVFFKNIFKINECFFNIILDNLIFKILK